MMTRLFHDAVLCATTRRWPGLAFSAIGPCLKKGPAHSYVTSLSLPTFAPISVKRAVYAAGLQNKKGPWELRAPNVDLGRKRQRTSVRASLQNDKLVQSPDPEKRPSRVLHWIDRELFELESTFVKGFWEEGAENNRLAKRKLTYPAYAEAVLQSWADQSNREDFIGELCDWAWNIMSDQELPLLRRAAVELFLEEFLGGDEFGLATAVKVDGLSGSQFLVPLLNNFIVRVAIEANHKALNKEQLRRLETFLENLNLQHVYFDREWSQEGSRGSRGQEGAGRDTQSSSLEVKAKRLRIKVRMKVTLSRLSTDSSAENKDAENSRFSFQSRGTAFQEAVCQFGLESHRMYMLYVDFRNEAAAANMAMKSAFAFFSQRLPCFPLDLRLGRGDETKSSRLFAFQIISLPDTFIVYGLFHTRDCWLFTTCTVFSCYGTLEDARKRRPYSNL